VAIGAAYLYLLDLVQNIMTSYLSQKW